MKLRVHCVLSFGNKSRLILEGAKSRQSRNLSERRSLSSFWNLRQFLLYAFRPLGKERDGNDITFDMRHVARGDATRCDATRVCWKQSFPMACVERQVPMVMQRDRRGRREGILGALWQMTNPSRIGRKPGGRRGAEETTAVGTEGLVTEPVLAECAERIWCCLNFAVCLPAELYTCRCKCYSLPDRWKLSRTGGRRGREGEGRAGSTKVISVHAGI